jgi:hypothetical protein
MKLKGTGALPEFFWWGGGFDSEAVYNLYVILKIVV